MRRRFALAVAAVTLVGSACSPGSGGQGEGQKAAAPTTAPRPSTTTTTAAPETTTTAAPAPTEPAPTEPAAPATTAPASPPTTAATPKPAPRAPSAAPASPAPAEEPSRARLGRIVSDSGFRPNANGFVFPNYGNKLSDGSQPTNLTVDDLRQLFGDAVCQSTANGDCQLTPQASAWLDQANQQMTSGHCYGFAVVSSLLWMRKLAAGDFGGPATTSLAITRNINLQRRIAADWATQLISAVRSRVVGGSPNDVLAKLIDSLRPDAPELFTLAFWKPDGSGGHAVTPFAVEDRGGGDFKVLIYDNNFPNQTREMSFDNGANTWTYAASANPSSPQQVYSGNASTQNVVLYPVSAGLGQQPCPFCSTRTAAAAALGLAGPVGDAGLDTTAPPATQEIFLVGSQTDHPDLLITDRHGRRLGFVKGKLVREIPGARVDLPLSDESWRINLAPHFVVPADQGYTITLDGAVITGQHTESLAVIANGFNLSVPNIPVRPGDHDIFELGPHGDRFRYTSSAHRAPTVELAVTDGAASYQFKLRGIDVRRGTTLDVGLPVGGRSLSIAHVRSTTPSKLKVQITRHAASGVQLFLADGLPLRVGTKATLDLGSWTAPRDPIPLTIRRGPQASTTPLANDLYR